MNEGRENKAVGLRMCLFLQDFTPFRSYLTPVNTRIIPILAAVCLLLTGCHPNTLPSTPNTAPSEHDQAAAANALFLNQKTFDPWVLTSTDPENPVPLYLVPHYPDGSTNFGFLIGAGGYDQSIFQRHYVDGQLEEKHPLSAGRVIPAHSRYQQQLDLRTGRITTLLPFGSAVYDKRADQNLARLWQTSDIVITGDPEAQQVTHANLYYLISSISPNSYFSIPPMGLSSNIYGGHIFWDAEVWMMPALIVQHPDYAKSIVDYRFKTLAQAKKNAKAHSFAGAEYPWESADTGAEMAPAEFAKERHITADVGWAAWQYYLWTGDKAYLAKEGWPILQATAQYWVARVTKGGDGKYHIKGVLSPDETAGVVDDDAYTNAVVQANLWAAKAAAKALGQTADPRWSAIAAGLFFPQDKTRGIPAENSKPLTDRFAAKQADTLLLIHPLNVPFDPATAGKMLDFYTAHTIKNGPAMTTSIEAVVAARLGRAQSSLDLFHDSYRPFMRGPWDAFAEKRTSNRVYFCTGMGGCLQSVLYGFAGLQVVAAGEKASGTKIAGDSEASLYAAPHLPPGWGGLTIKGVQFHANRLDIVVTSGNKVKAIKK